MEKIYTKYLLIVGFLVFAACEDSLVENSPSNISLVSFYQSEDDALAGLYGAYNDLYSVLPALLLYGEMNADDLTVSPIVSDYMSWDEFTYNNDVTESLWAQGYSGINRANEVILYTEGVDFDINRKADLIAEARALRAIYYFQLVRTMGGVPLYTAPTTGFDDIYAARATEDEVYNLIISDLEDAAMELEGTSASGRINANIANAFLARVYLYRSDYSNALIHARKVIDTGTYDLLPDFANLFKPEHNNSIEHIYQLQYLSGEVNNSIPGEFAPRTSSLFQNSFWAGTTPPGSYAPSSGFIAENPISYRRSATIADQYEHIDGVSGTVTMEEMYGGIFPFFIDKFSDRKGELQSGANQTIIRYADILLIAAEALNEVDPANDEKYGWINHVRQRARNGVESDLPDLAGLTTEQFRQAVLEERRFELAFEGERAWDLKRRDLFLEKLRTQGKIIEDYMLLFPIPDTQIKLNTNLIQNDGW